MFWFCGILVLAVSLFSDANAQSKTDADVCQLPEGGVGTCILIHNCKPMLDFLDKAIQPLSPLTIKQLKSYRCGFEGRNPKVCCASTPLITQLRGIGNVLDEIPDVTGHRNLKLLPHSCGYLDTDSPTSNGYLTRLFEFPWMALLSYKTQRGLGFKCAGSIINDRYILTAAHCISLSNPDYTLAGVRIGEHDTRTYQDCETLSSGEKVCAPNVQDLHVQEMIPHPQYKRNTFSNDIGLLRVDRMNLTLENARPVCLPLGSARKYNFTDKNVILAGWGITETGRPSPVLLTVELPVVGNEQCREAYVKSIPITKRQLCAGGRDRTDTCAGDSGGPLHVVDLVNDEMRYVQQGIVSFGSRRCGLDGIPSVNTLVAYYMDWILDMIRP